MNGWVNDREAGDETPSWSLWRHRNEHKKYQSPRRKQKRIICIFIEVGISI